MTTTERITIHNGIGYAVVDGYVNDNVLTWRTPGSFPAQWNVCVLLSQNADGSYEV